MGQEPSQIREEIAETRNEMGDTVDALAYKADVKTRVKDSVAEKRDQVVGQLKGATGKVSDATAGLSDVADRLKQSMLGGSSIPLAGTAKSARNAVTGLTDREPLIVAAMGLAIGTAIGAMLPESDLENEGLGAQGDRLRKGAGDLVNQGLQSVRNVASKAYEAVKEEADHQGLKPDPDNPFASRIGEVLKSAAETTEDAVRAELGTGSGGGRDN